MRARARPTASTSRSPQRPTPTAFARSPGFFGAAAAAETVHAHAHLRVMSGVGDTKQNLEAAVAGEAHEFREMYPKFVDEAESERNQGAVASFRNAMAVEKIHHELYSRALEAANRGKDLPASAIYVCDVCGNTIAGDAPDKCPVCGASRSHFQDVA